MDWTRGRGRDMSSTLTQVQRSTDGNTITIIHMGEVFVDKLMTRAEMLLRGTKQILLHDHHGKHEGCPLKREYQWTLRNNAQQRLEKLTCH